MFCFPFSFLLSLQLICICVSGAQRVTVLFVVLFLIMIRLFSFKAPVLFLSFCLFTFLYVLPSLIFLFASSFFGFGIIPSVLFTFCAASFPPYFFFAAVSPFHSLILFSLSYSVFILSFLSFSFIYQNLS